MFATAENDTLHCAADVIASASALNAEPDFPTQGVFAQYHPRFGFATYIEDQIGLAVTNTYDSAGNLTQTSVLPLLRMMGSYLNICG